MTGEKEAQGKPTAKASGALGIIVGALAALVPLCNIGSSGDTLSFLGLLQAALGMDKAGYSDSVRGSLTVDAILILAFIAAVLVVGISGLRAKKASKAMALLPIILMAVYIAYMMIQRNSGWNADASLFAWLLLILSVALAAVQAKI